MDFISATAFVPRYVLMIVYIVACIDINPFTQGAVIREIVLDDKGAQENGITKETLLLEIDLVKWIEENQNLLLKNNDTDLQAMIKLKIPDSWQVDVRDYNNNNTGIFKNDRIPKGCLPNPCQNGGRCSAAEDPYGFGYYCVCPEPTGGRHCQFKDPCKDYGCPQPELVCRRASTVDDGRFCYDTTDNWKTVPLLPIDQPPL